LLFQKKKDITRELNILREEDWHLREIRVGVRVFWPNYVYEEDTGGTSVN